jgi:hypothetical protein
MRSIELALAIIGAWIIISLVAGGLLVMVRGWLGRRAPSVQVERPTTRSRQQRPADFQDHEEPTAA